VISEHLTAPTHLYIHPSISSIHPTGTLFSILTDELVHEVLSYLDGRDLSVAVQLSKMFYCHASFGDLWLAYDR
jgi:hypothetical protein